MQSKLGGVVNETQEITIPQSAMLTAPFTQGSLWRMLHLNLMPRNIKILKYDGKIILTISCDLYIMQIVGYIYCINNRR